MCSRYFLDADGNVIAYAFRVPPNERIARRYNIAPTQDAPVVRVNEAGAREAAMLRWGLVPAWAKDIGVGNRMINARAEGIETKPAFRDAIRSRRCLVPASGFYEWKGAAGRKQPYAITAAGRPLFAFAGVWERWKPRGADDPRGRGTSPEVYETFAIVTTDAAPAVQPIHDRMPVIVAPEDEAAWLGGSVEAALALLKPYDGKVAVRAVSRVVSDPRNEIPECLNDAEPTWDQTSLL